LKESALVQQVITYLRLKGHTVFRMNAGAVKTGPYGQHRIQLAPVGCPDIIGWQKGTGRFIGVECKIKPNKPTELQQQFGRTMQADNCIYILAYSLDDVIQQL